MAATAERNARASGAEAGSATSSAARIAEERADERAGEAGAEARRGRSFDRKGAGAKDCGQKAGDRKAWEERKARSGGGGDPPAAPAGRRRARARREWRCAREARCGEDDEAGAQREESQVSLSARRRSGFAATRSQSSLSASIGFRGGNAVRSWVAAAADREGGRTHARGRRGEGEAETEMRASLL